METANIMLAIGGDPGNVVPKFNITASEIAVLRIIHGNDAVTDVEPTGDVFRDPVTGKSLNHREERARLMERYGLQHEGRFISPAVDSLFPGAAARVFEKLDELDLPEELYKAEKRAAPPTAKKASEAPAEPEVDPLNELTKAELVEVAKEENVAIDPASKKADILAAIRTARDAAKSPGDEEDGIGDMRDESLFS